MNDVGYGLIIAAGNGPTLWDRLGRILTLQDHTTRIVLLGTTVLG